MPLSLPFLLSTFSLQIQAFVRFRLYVLCLTLITSLTLLASVSSQAFADTLKPLSYTLLKTQPHDSTLFTQGLIQDGPNLIESSGLYRHSFVRIYNQETGEKLKQVDLPPQIFAEGLTLFNHYLYVLSWKAGVLFMLDPETLKTRKTRRYKGQGWGITHDGQHLYMSDGSHRLYQRDPSTFAIIKTLNVTHPDTGEPIDRLNELEFAHGLIWANRWKTNHLLAISPKTGLVVGELDLTRLVPQGLENHREKVLNGIAFDIKSQGFWVTGKNWPVRYLIQLDKPLP